MRPQTSYGGVSERQKNLQSSLKLKNEIKKIDKDNLEKKEFFN
jgi:hypothetical protein